MVRESSQDGMQGVLSECCVGITFPSLPKECRESIEELLCFNKTSLGTSSMLCTIVGYCMVSPKRSNSHGVYFPRGAAAEDSSLMFCGSTGCVSLEYSSAAWSLLG